MKTLRSLLIILAGICLLMTCEKSEDLATDDLTAAELKCAPANNQTYCMNQDRYVFMKNPKLRIHYKVIGKGTVNMVFIPGWTNPLDIFQKQFDFFKDKARCIYIDMPGQGLSSAPCKIEYTMGLMADAIYEVLKKEGVKHFVAVGFSMGPVPLGQFQLRHPGMITRLVNLDGDFYPWPKDPAEKEAYSEQLVTLREQMTQWTVEDKKGFASMLLSESSPDDLIKFVSYFYTFPSPLMANIYYNVMVEDVNQPIGWKFPILCIYSVRPTDIQYLRLYFPGADIRVLEGGHVVQWEHYQVVNEWIRDFALNRPGGIL
jgi:pimeloyl-ACP methyl ester carboxylesterase